MERGLGWWLMFPGLSLGCTSRSGWMDRWDVAWEVPVVGRKVGGILSLSLELFVLQSQMTRLGYCMWDPGYPSSGLWRRHG